MLRANLTFFYSMIRHGNMNTNSKFYKEGMTKEEIRRNFDRRRIILGEEYSYSGLRVLTPIQKARPDLTNKSYEEMKVLQEKYNSKYQDGHYIRVTNGMVEPYKDLYDLDLYADILMMDDKVKDVALVYPVADCPVVIAEDNYKKAVAMAHCGGEYIDRELPGQLIDSLREEFDSKPYDISIYIGPHAQVETFTYDRYPKFIQNPKNWEGCLYEKNGLIHINMNKAIIEQLTNRGVELDTIYSSKIDTITNPDFYSNSAARLDETKAGRFYTGCVYNDVKYLSKCLYKNKY